MGPHHPIDEALLERLPTDESAAGDEAHKPCGAKIKVEQQGAVPELLEALARVEERDNRAETMAPLMTGVGIVALIVAVAMGALFANVPAGIVAAIVGVFGLIAAWAYRTEDVSDRQLAAICTVLSTFASELRPKRPVNLAADFTGLEKTPATKDGARKIYRHDWLRLELPLADGTTARIQASSSLKRKSRAKRKYTKHKDQVSDQLTIQLIPPKGKRLSAEGKTPRPQLDGLTLTRAQVKPRQATFTFRSRSPLRRVHGRGGWSLMSAGDLIDGHKVVAAVIQSYKATATAHRGAA